VAKGVAATKGVAGITGMPVATAVDVGVKGAGATTSGAGWRQAASKTSPSNIPIIIHFCPYQNLIIISLFPTGQIS
jgi:hypothetical protein